MSHFLRRTMSSAEQSANPLNSNQIDDTLKNVLQTSNKDATKHLLIDEIRGYDLNQGIDYDKLFQTYRTTGFQATNFAKSIDEINRMVGMTKRHFLRLVHSNNEHFFCVPFDYSIRSNANSNRFQQIKVNQAQYTRIAQFSWATRRT
jgi:hypothetical protein